MVFFCNKESGFLKRLEMVKKNSDFKEIILNGKSIKAKYYNIYYKDIDNKCKFGLAVSKKIGNAVVRNKIKRRVKAIIDKNKKLFSNKNYIIMVKREILNLSFKEMEENLIEMLKKGK